MDIRSFFGSKTVWRIAVGFGIAVAVLVVFRAGMIAGYHQARFGGGLGDNYYRAFGDDRMFEREIPGGFPNAHGVAGKVISVDIPMFVVADRDGVEKTVVIKDDTVIRRSRDEVQPADIQPDGFVIVIGSPNEGAQIEAKLIRIMPSPPDGFDGSQTGPARMMPPR